MKILVVTPTLNESKNIAKLIKKIFNVNLKLSLLIVDDNSLDGTRKKIIFFKRKFKLLNYIFRPRKLGIGSAHKRGIKWAIENNYDYCITLDADLTHNPILINKMINLSKKNSFHIVSTSRFKLSKSLKSWPALRIFITKLRYFLVRLLLKTNLDSSGGFRCYNLNTIKKKHFFLSKNNSYFFLIESLYYFEKLKYRIHEIPIVLPYRLYGSSKMRLIDILNSLLLLIKLRFRKI